MDEDPDDSPRKPSKKKTDATNEIIGMLKANMLQMEEMEEERLLMQQMHDEEKARLEERMEELVDQFLTHKKEQEIKLEIGEEELRKLEREKEALQRQNQQSHAEQAHMREELARQQRQFQEMEEKMAETHRQMAVEKEEMAAAMERLQAEYARLEDEKASMLRQMEQTREEVTRLEQERRDLEERSSAFIEECQRSMHEKEQEILEKTQRIQAEAEFTIAEEKRQAEQRLADERRRREDEARQELERMQQEHEERRAAFERQVQAEKARMEQECNEKVENSEYLVRKTTATFNEERGRMELEKAALVQQMDIFRHECQAKMHAEEIAFKDRMEVLQRDFEERTAQEKRQMERKLAEASAQLAQKTQEFELERRRLAEERSGMIRHMDEVKAQQEQEFSIQQEEARKKMRELRAECQRQVAEEKAAAEQRLADMRAHTEAQLRLEQEVTEHVKIVLRELPPLQAAMELGDLSLLEDELWKWRGDELPARFGDCKAVVGAVVKLARERLLTWRGVDHTWKDTLREVEPLPASNAVLTQSCQRLFRTLKEAQLTRMDLRRSNPEAVDKACEVLLAWQSRVMTVSNDVHELIIRKAVTWPNLGTFDFVDLDMCLQLVDRRPEDSEVFLSRIRALVEDPNTAPKDFRGLFSHVETMLFFLKYAKMENVQKTHAEFERQFPQLDPFVVKLIQAAELDYPVGGELVRLSDDRNLLNSSTVSAVLQEMRMPKATRSGPGIGLFREIFYQWAVAMQTKFNLLVLPHHTQVMCLLTFKHFLEQVQHQSANGAGLAGAQQLARTLIAQVGTGEGKSMIVAAMAIFVVVALGKQAHVVVDDETLLERDFWMFKCLFDTFEARTPTGVRKLTSVLCVSEEKLVGAGSKGSAMAARVDPAADICYCEAKHVQSFYASIARSEQRDFDSYRNRVLILDEVDALVIDEEPNEAFVYPNQELGRLATRIAEALKQKVPPSSVMDAVRASQHPATSRVVNMMTMEWEKASKLVIGEDVVFAKDIGRYCTLHGGRANTRAWSLALECRNFQDGFSREILFQERLFIMSRPRVFRKYFAIIGLTGSIGSQPERAFLHETYGATFFEVPPFLKTCRGESHFHEAVPTPFGSARRQVYVERGLQEQMQRIAEVVFEARDRVPVLIIGKDRGFCEQLVEFLHQAARTQGLGRIASDIIRSLSRTLYESDPEQWKENLNRATMPVGGTGQGEAGGGKKSWRITVTDPRGARGTDYRVDDPDVDACGGLLLIPAVVPPSQREWIQFLGRTARQDRRGQYCAILCEADYKSAMTKYGGSLGQGSLQTIDEILRWGDQDAGARVRASAALYNNGVRMNELCEEVFGRRPEVLREPASRELLVDCCQRHRWMSVREVDQAFARIPGLDVAALATEARDLGRPAEPPAATSASSLRMAPGTGARTTGEAARGLEPPRIVLFCLDCSASMMSRDTGTPYTRFELCVKSIRQILQNQVRDCDQVGVITFGSVVTDVLLPTQKGAGRQLIDAKIAGLRIDSRGGTCFYDAVVKCLQLLGQADAGGGRWLICLTDGDDLGSRMNNNRGQLVTSTLQAGAIANLSMVMITVGALQAQNLQIIGSWVERVKASGGTGQLLAEKDAGRIEMAFQVVAECLAAEVGGAIEC